MYYLLGTDEAGYGPNLGPLMVTATLWRVENSQVSPESLYSALAPVVGEHPNTCEIAVTDSKKLHKKTTLLPLERAIFPVLYALGLWDGCQKLDSDALFDRICGPDSGERRAVPWNVPETRREVPVNLDLPAACRLGELLKKKMRETGISLVALHSDAVFPERFNDGTKIDGSKGTFLADTTLRLVSGFWREIASETPDVRILCDKFGGRNFYLPLLWEHFPDREFLVDVESRERSEYVSHFPGSDAELRIRFQAKGESNLAAALSSIVCKYLREVSMARFNAYWRGRLPDLAPTAGYPQDAVRFRREILARLPDLQLDWNSWWRNK